MHSNWKIIILFFIVILIAAALRFYQLDKIPPGLIIDEASEGYNAFSLLKTGKDRYGESYPILFRSFGSFQAPLYTYLTIIPIYLFGNSIFSIHFISVVSGLVLIITTFILIIYAENKEGLSLAVISAFLIAISPWAIFFNRIGTEASLGATIFALSFLLLYLSLRRLWLFPVATLILGLSTHAYYSERLISVLFLMSFIFILRKHLLQKKKILILGLISFSITQIPHLLILTSGAFTRRISQVDYFNEQFFQMNGDFLRLLPFGKIIFIVREFFSQYLAYFSPKNLFFDPDPQGARSMPDLSAFYPWMIIPFIFGLKSFLMHLKSSFIQMFLLLIILAPIPASLTRDPFSTIRILVFLWGITIVIAYGVQYLLARITFFKLKFFFVTIAILFSLSQLYLSYFVLLKYERSENYGYSYLELLGKIATMTDKHFVVDSSRELGTGIRFAFIKKYDPLSLQKVLTNQAKGKYYSNFEYGEPYSLDNIEARPIVWDKDVYKEQILVGDLLAISESQAKEHYLKFIFDIKNRAGDIALKAYITDPQEKCQSDRRNGQLNLKYCSQY